jgi:hypothetical protein
MPRIYRRGPQVSQRLVVDASISLAWSLDDETDNRADEALTIVEHSGAISFNAL